MAIGRGLHFRIMNRELFAEDLFAGVCVAHGCAPLSARKIANTVATEGEAKTTITQSVNMAHLRNGASVLGVLVVEIAPRRG